MTINWKFWTWHRCRCRTQSDDTGCWGECVICHKRYGFVTRAELRAFSEHEQAARQGMRKDTGGLGIETYRCGECNAIISQYGKDWLDKDFRGHHYCGGETNQWQPHFPILEDDGECAHVQRWGLPA
jgi:hypothetical protein